jgi:hypothetical protein
MLTILVSILKNQNKEQIDVFGKFTPNLHQNKNRELAPKANPLFLLGKTTNVMVEAAGVEPASENTPLQASTCLFLFKAYRA